MHVGYCYYICTLLYLQEKESPVFKVMVGHEGEAKAEGKRPNGSLFRNGVIVPNLHYQKAYQCDNKSGMAGVETVHVNA